MASGEVAHREERLQPPSHTSVGRAAGSLSGILRDGPNERNGVRGQEHQQGGGSSIRQEKPPGSVLRNRQCGERRRQWWPGLWSGNQRGEECAANQLGQRWMVVLSREKAREQKQQLDMVDSPTWAPGSLKQGTCCDFYISRGYRVRPCLKSKQSSDYSPEYMCTSARGNLGC